MSERLTPDPAACANCLQPVRETEAKFCPICGVNLAIWGQTAVPPSSSNILSLISTHSPITIGRAADNSVRLDHPAVSAYHAHLEWREEAQTWFVVDLQSANGTFINYRKVMPGSAGEPLNSQTDTLWIAPYAFRLGGDSQTQPKQVEPAHLRLDAVDLVRTVKHARSGQNIHILNLTQTPLSFRPGEFIALVGGSGAGKSTLMKALLGLNPAQEGTVFVGERPFIMDGQVEQFQAMHAVVGYVPQDDIVHHELTPLEALDYIARLRLSPDLNREERHNYIKETLETVELWPHRDKLIRQLSGGQRKRVNIALELLARPRLLFLDEPTSGLDPGLDLAMMELLRHWAADPSDPRTIILVTHATENVRQCKYVVFMAPGGFVVYFGPPQQALAYFGVTRFAEIYRLVGAYQLPELTTDSTENEQSDLSDVRDLVARFLASPDHFHYVQARQLNSSGKAMNEVIPSAKASSPRFSPSTRAQSGRQFRLLTLRYWKLIRRDRLNFAILLLQGLLVAGLLWAVAKPDTFQVRGAENAQTVLFIMACAAVWLGILNATKEIVKERDIYDRERRYGILSAPYVLSKLFVLAGIGAVQIGTMLWLISFRITFPMRGALGNWSPAGLEWFITLELTMLAGLALGLFLSANVKTIDAATAVMFVLLLIQVMFAGLFFPDAAWADIISVLTFSRWALEGVGITADLNGLLSAAIGSAYRPDTAYTYSPWHLLARWAVLVGYTILFTLLTIRRQARR